MVKPQGKDIQDDFGLTLQEQAHVLSSLCYAAIDGDLERCPMRWLADLDKCPVTGSSGFCFELSEDIRCKWHKCLTHRQKKRSLEREKQYELTRHEFLQRN